jgi:hypothetical protein
MLGGLFSRSIGSADSNRGLACTRTTKLLSAVPRNVVPGSSLHKHWLYALPESVQLRRIHEAKPARRNGEWLAVKEGAAVIPCKPVPISDPRGPFRPPEPRWRAPRSQLESPRTRRLDSGIAGRCHLDWRSRGRR